MRILYIAMKYDYGDLKRGYSYEHYNFYDSLVKMENRRYEVVYFPFDEITKEIGEDEMNKKLLETVWQEKPDLCFFFLFGDEIKKETIKKIAKESGSITFNWFADDHFRFYNFSKYYAPCFHWISTTDSQAVEKYHKIGYKNVIKTQWACNHFLYKPQNDAEENRQFQRDSAQYQRNSAYKNFSDNPLGIGDIPRSYKYKVSFVGQPYGNRRQIIAKVKKAGIDVQCFGLGWENGRVGQEEMIKIFSQSKINLNFTKSSGKMNLKSLAFIFLNRKLDGSLKVTSPKYWIGNFKSILARRREQIKGRNFEIPGCGGFLITHDADNLGDYYKFGKEIVIYQDIEELIEKIHYYLAHEAKRETIAQAGYTRTLQDHTYEKRFKEIFKIIGLK
ncbi:MAG: glycosyltransferase [Patescibacteria group bacterium]|nr:glycosyltransferase [Patescibacteria group bacterium]